MFAPSNASSYTTQPSSHSDVDDDAAADYGTTQVSNRKRRKAVAFSRFTDVIMIELQDGQDPPAAASNHKQPLANKSNTLSETKPRPFRRHSYDCSAGGPVSAPPAATLDYSKIPLETVSITSRKRRRSLTSTTVSSSTSSGIRHATIPGPSLAFSRAQDAVPPRSARRAADAQQVPQKRASTATGGKSDSAAASPPPDIPPAVPRSISRERAPTDDSAQPRRYVVHTLKFAPREECVVLLDARVERLLPTTFAPLPASADDAVAVGRTEGMGVGLFAARAIRDGESLLRERPALIVPHAAGPAVPLEQLYADVVRRLPSTVVHRLQDLAVCGGKEPAAPLRNPLEFERVVRTHALAIALAVPEGSNSEHPAHRGLFLRTSLCNHRCEIFEIPLY